MPTTIHYSNRSDGRIVEVVMRNNGTFYMFTRRKNPSGIGYAEAQTTELTRRQVIAMGFSKEVHEAEAHVQGHPAWCSICRKEQGVVPAIASQR